MDSNDWYAPLVLSLILTPQYKTFCQVQFSSVCLINICILLVKICGGRTVFRHLKGDWPTENLHFRSWMEMKWTKTNNACLKNRCVRKPDINRCVVLPHWIYWWATLSHSGIMSVACYFCNQYSYLPSGNATNPLWKRRPDEGLLFQILLWRAESELYQMYKI